MLKAQTSIELIMVFSIIVLITISMTARYLSVEEEIFTDASARQAFLSEITKIDSKYYLQKVESKSCENKVVINYITKPEMKTQDEQKAKALLKEALKNAPGIKEREVEVQINTPKPNC